jgi:hypothetical protein
VGRRNYTHFFALILVTVRQKHLYLLMRRGIGLTRRTFLDPYTVPSGRYVGVTSLNVDAEGSDRL